METDPSDSAFPVSVRRGENYVDDDGCSKYRTVTLAVGGLTKREYFAAKAMQGMLAHETIGLRNEGIIAQLAVKQADALIAALNED